MKLLHICLALCLAITPAALVAQQKAVAKNPATNEIIEDLTIGSGRTLTVATGGSLISTSSLIGNLRVMGDGVSRYQGANDGDTLELNYSGYLGGFTKFRNTAIFNGKGTRLLDADGGSGLVRIYNNLQTNGSIAAGTSTAAGFMYINGPAATSRSLYLQTAGLNRWAIGVDNSAESGSNSGSAFSISRRNDAGSYLDTVLFIPRDSGTVAITTGLDISSGSKVISFGNGYGTLAWKLDSSHKAKVTGDSGTAKELFLHSTNMVSLGVGSNENYLDVKARVTSSGLQVEKGNSLRLYNPANAAYSSLATDASGVLQLTGVSSLKLNGNVDFAQGAIQAAASEMRIFGTTGSTLTLGANGAAAKLTIGTDGNITTTGTLTTVGLIQAGYNLAINGADSSYKELTWKTNNVRVWNWLVDNSPQTGGASGTGGNNFQLARYDNSGNYLDTPISINRSNGTVSVLPIAINGGQTIQKVLSATTTWDPPSLAAGASASTTITLTGVAADGAWTCMVPSHTSIAAAVMLCAYPSAANTVTVTMINLSGATQDFASGTLRVSAFRF
jgi:hypothetical protein